MAYQLEKAITPLMLSITMSPSATWVDRGFCIPIFKPNKRGKRADITMTVEERAEILLADFNFVGTEAVSYSDLIA